MPLATASHCSGDPVPSLGRCGVFLVETAPPWAVGAAVDAGEWGWRQANATLAEVAAGAYPDESRVAISLVELTRSHGNATWSQVANHSREEAAFVAALGGSQLRYGLDVGAELVVFVFDDVVDPVMLLVGEVRGDVETVFCDASPGSCPLVPAWLL